MEVLNISKVVVIKTISKKKKCKKTKWLSDKDLQIVEKIREMKGIGEKERYTHLNFSISEETMSLGMECN